MQQLKDMIWLFPILFSFHDFEEIVFLIPWIRKNADRLSSRFPPFRPLSRHFKNLTTSAFTLGVYEEFVIISAVTLFAYFNGDLKLWSGLFIAFAIHLIIHCFQAIIIKGYVPAVITSVICLPFCCIIIRKILISIPATSILIYSVVCIILMALNLAVIHTIMERFVKWQRDYETGK